MFRSNMIVLLLGIFWEKNNEDNLVLFALNCSEKVRKIECNLANRESLQLQIECSPSYQNPVIQIYVPLAWLQITCDLAQTSVTSTFLMCVGSWLTVKILYGSLFCWFVCLCARQHVLCTEIGNQIFNFPVILDNFQYLFISCKYCSLAVWWMRPIVRVGINLLSVFLLVNGPKKNLDSTRNILGFGSK